MKRTLKGATNLIFGEKFAFPMTKMMEKKDIFFRFFFNISQKKRDFSLYCTGETAWRNEKIFICVYNALKVCSGSVILWLTQKHNFCENLSFLRFFNKFVRRFWCKIVVLHTKRCPCTFLRCKIALKASEIQFRTSNCVTRRVFYWFMRLRRPN